MRILAFKLSEKGSLGKVLSRGILRLDSGFQTLLSCSVTRMQKGPGLKQGEVATSVILERGMVVQTGYVEVGHGLC